MLYNDELENLLDDGLSWFEDGKYYGVPVKLINLATLYDYSSGEYKVGEYPAKVIDSDGLIRMKYNGENNSFYEPITQIELPLWCYYTPEGYKDNLNPYDETDENGNRLRYGTVEKMADDVIKHPLIVNCVTNIYDMEMMGTLSLQDMFFSIYIDNDALYDVTNNRAYTQQLSHEHRYRQALNRADKYSYNRYMKYLENCEGEPMTPAEFREVDIYEKQVEDEGPGRK